MDSYSVTSNHDLFMNYETNPLGPICDGLRSALLMGLPQLLLLSGLVLVQNTRCCRSVLPQRCLS